MPSVPHTATTADLRLSSGSIRIHPLELPVVELVDGHLDRQDVIPQASIPLAPVLRYDRGTFCGDAFPDSLSDHPVASQALIRLPVLAVEQVTIDGDGRGG